jgi:sensor histidine kinase YesM
MKISFKNSLLICSSDRRMRENLLFIILFFLLILTTHSQENSFQQVEAFTAYKNYKIEEITQDKFNNIWFATNKGLLKFDGVSITNSDFKIGESLQKITTIYATNDSLFIGKNKNLYLKTHNRLLTFNAKNVNKIVKYKSKIFVASNEGIYHFKKDYLHSLTTINTIDFAVINDLIFYHNSFYIASNKGLWKLDKLYKPIKIVKLKNGEYNSFLEVKKALFVIKNSSSILEITTKDKLIERYASNDILKINEINNDIYVTTKNDGIIILDNQNFIFQKRINKYNSNLKSNRIYSVFEDAEKNIFIATENSLYIKKNAKIIEKSTLVISDIVINYFSVDSIRVDNYNKVLQLEPKQNNVSFLFQNISISTPEKIEYRYKLKGDFSPWSNSTRIDFANLNYGKYNFIVESRLKNSEKINHKNFSFYIAMPLYKKTWFIILSIAVTFLLLTFFVDLYIRKINRKNKQKVDKLQLKNYLLNLEQKALQLQMNPHFIFNVLNGIKALGNTGNIKELNTTISQFSVLLRSILNNSRLEEISLQDEIETLKNYLDLEQKMSAKKFEYFIKTDSKNIALEEILIPPMLVQPFVENSIKHGVSSILKDGKIDIHFEVKQHFLRCTIIDNGIAFFQSKKEKTPSNHTSVGLKVTKERIENLSKYSTFTIEDIKKSQTVLGTKVYFKIPLKTDY